MGSTRNRNACRRPCARWAMAILPHVGAAEETPADAVHYPGTYLAGGYNRLKTTLAGRIIEMKTS